MEQTLKMTVRPSGERGVADHGWLKAKHSFSFSDYYDPDFMSYRSLRVINEDRVAPRNGFGRHPHDNMEIFTYIISGELKHEDSMGNGRTIKAGEFQYMSAGSGVYHSEFNHGEEETHLLQIWITPNQRGGEPKYAELDTKGLSTEGGLTLFSSADGRDGSVQMRQEAEIYFGKGEGKMQIPPSPYEGAWIQMIQGSLKVGEHILEAGDGASIEGAQNGFPAEAVESTEFILFRLI